ncbi:hypothetical protein BC833DRAFT_623620 [Globomyces pollinis-pini]|nr:hypothetical protein BC833DRAFT_623620 [Globomyces pollinis-pini]
MTEMMFNQKWLLPKYEAWTNSIAPVTVDGSWIIENPGQQMLTGSFQPIESTWDEWLGFVNVHHQNLASWKMAADFQAKRLGGIQAEGRSPPSVYWVPVVDDKIPTNAIPMFTKADGTTVYAGRTYDESNYYGKSCVLIGEVMNGVFKFNTDYENKESKDYEVLVGDSKAVSWHSLQNNGPFVISNHTLDGKRLVFGGNSNTTSLYMGRGECDRATDSGEIIETDTHLGYFSYQSYQLEGLPRWAQPGNMMMVLVYSY